MSDPVPAHVAAAVQAIGLDVATAEIVSALELDGITSVLLKGPATARHLYAEAPGERTYVDADLLVAPRDFDRAEGVLARLGFAPTLGRLRPIERSLVAVTPWAREAPSPAQIDLHRGFHGVRRWESFWDEVSAHTEVLLLHGQPVRIPDPAGCALIVALHDTAVARTAKSAMDLERALTLLDQEVWAEAARRAGRCGAAEAFRLGLSRHPGGDELADRLGLSPVLSSGLAIHGLAEVGADPAPAAAAALLVERLGHARGWGTRTRIVLNIAFPSADHLRAHRSLARRGGLGLLVTRLVWPLDLLRRAPRVVVLLLAGRRAAARSRRSVS